MKRLLILFFILIFNALYSQVKVSGYIFDKTDNSPLPGVNICEVNTKNCVQTDFNGKFEIVVKDSLAIIDISYMGYKRIKINVKDYKGENIYLEEDAIIEIDCVYPDRIYFGYYGDLTKFPYGINFYYDVPYRFLGALFYKTDFDSHYDLKLKLDKISINEINFHRHIAPSFIFQKRKYYKLNINDYQLVLSFPLKKIIPQAGFALKYDYQKESLDKAVILGFSKYIQPTLSKVYSKISLYKDCSEYNIGLEQRLAVKKKFWRNIRLGVQYQKYREYDELNFLVSYLFFYL